MPLRLGFTPFVHKTLLHSVTELYKELLPDCEIMPESDDTDELTSRVRQDILDAAIVTLPILEDDLEVQVIERERLVVCMRSDDPLTDHYEIPPEALNQKICIFTYQRHHPTAYNHLVEMLVIMPLIVYGLSVWLGLNPLYTIAAVICAAVPTAKTVYILAGEYQCEEMMVASTVSLTTLASVISLVAWLYGLSGLTTPIAAR